MAEYVDKQKARDLFQRKCYNVSDRINSVEVGMFVEGIMQVLDEATAADVQPVNRWISVKDRLPGENTLVLCYARSTTGEGNQYFIGAIAHGEFWFLKVNDIGHVSYPVLNWEVTHWQSLSKPPKDGEQND